MDSRISQVELLLKEGRAFTAQNFCLPRRSISSSGGEFGGADTPEWRTWKTRALNLVQQVASPNSPAVQLADTGASIRTEGFYLENFVQAKGNLLKALELTLEALKSDVFDEVRKPGTQAPSRPSPKNTATRRVFVVHGHDEVLKLDVARFIEKLGFEALILAEQANQGRTIIEKLEAHAESSGFAVILLTPDDVGTSASTPSALKSRARQNVILELGYFIGRLGRSRVCALHKGDVELPSDILGVVYISVGGNWKLQLAAEMKAVWPDLDLNRAH